MKPSMERSTTQPIIGIVRKRTIMFANIGQNISQFLTSYLKRLEIWISLFCAAMIMVRTE